MALSAEIVKQMKQLAKFSPEQVETMLRELAAADPETWRSAVNTLFLTMWTRQSTMYKIMQQIVQSLDIPAAAHANGAVAAPEAPSGAAGPVLGADGQPITDPQQLEAEQLMNAAAGPRPGTTAAAAAAQTAAAPRAAAGPVLGADGQPITDPQQLEAERIMNEVIGPR